MATGNIALARPASGILVRPLVQLISGVPRRSPYLVRTTDNRTVGSPSQVPLLSVLHNYYED